MNRIKLLTIFLLVNIYVYGQLSTSPIAKTNNVDIDLMIDAIELGDKIIFSTFSKTQIAHIIVAYDTVDETYTCLYNSEETIYQQPELTKVGNKVFFRTIQDSDFKLWYTDGTIKGTKEYKDPAGEIELNSTSRMIEIHNRLYVEMKVGNLADKIYSIDENLMLRAINEFDWLGIGPRLDTIHLSGGRIAVWGDRIWIPLTINASHQFVPIFDDSFENENTIGSSGDTVIYSNFKRFYYQKRNSNRGTRINFDPQMLSAYERHLTKVHTHIYEGHMYCFYPEGDTFVLKKVNILTGENENLFSVAFPHEGYLKTHGELRNGIIYFSMPEGAGLFSMHSFDLVTEEISKMPIQMEQGNVHLYKNYVAFVGLDGNFYGYDSNSGETFFIAHRKVLQDPEYPIIPRKDRFEAGGKYFYNFDVHLRIKTLWELFEEDANLSVNITQHGRDICDSGSTTWLFPVVKGNSGPYTFAWSGGTPGGFAYEYVTIINSGNVSVTVTDQSGNTASKTLSYSNVNPKITATQSIKAAGGGTPSGEIAINVTNGPGNPYKFYWYHDTSTDSIATGLLPGSYTFEVLGKNYCKLKRTVTVPLGTNTTNLKIDSIKLYPNLLINSDRTIYFDHLPKELKTLELTNIEGRSLFKFPANALQRKVELPLDLLPGMYLLSFIGLDQPVTFKIQIVE